MQSSIYEPAIGVMFPKSVSQLKTERKHITKHVHTQASSVPSQTTLKRLRRALFQLNVNVSDGTLWAHFASGFR